MSKVDKFVDGMEMVKDGMDKVLCEDIPEEELECEDGKHKKRKKRRTRRLSMWKIKMIGVLVVVALIVILVLRWKASNWFGDFIDSMNGEHISVTESTLTKLLEINELSSVSCDYSSVVKIPVEGFWGTSDHSVAYSAEVHIGIDFSKVKVNINDEKGEIKVKLPDVKVLDTAVDASSLDFLDASDKEDTDFALEAYKKCANDVAKKIKKEKTLFAVAEENAKGAIEGLFQPILASAKKEYKIIFE